MPRMLAIASGLSLPHGVVMRSFLEAHGIAAHLDTYHHASMAWHHIQALDGRRLEVAEADAAAAADLIADIDARAPASPSRMDDAPLPTQLTRVVAAVAILAATGVPCPYWWRNIRADDDNAGA